MERVRTEFEKAVNVLRGSGDLAGAFDRLVQAYGEPVERAYHNLGHVEATLQTARMLMPSGDEEEWARVVLALAYHDAIYDSRAKDNEARSAEFAGAELSALGIDEADQMEIARLILLTRDHMVDESDEIGKMVVDADLAILQSPAEEYDRYAAAIRQEYAWVPDADYRVGRTRVLQGLMTKKLFASSLLNENRARANLAREIAMLS